MLNMENTFKWTKLITVNFDNSTKIPVKSKLNSTHWYKKVIENVKWEIDEIPKPKILRKVWSAVCMLCVFCL